MQTLQWRVKVSSDFRSSTRLAIVTVTCDGCRVGCPPRRDPKMKPRCAAPSLWCGIRTKSMKRSYFVPGVRGRIGRLLPPTGRRGIYFLPLIPLRGVEHRGSLLCSTVPTLLFGTTTDPLESSGRTALPCPRTASIFGPAVHFWALKLSVTTAGVLEQLEVPVGWRFNNDRWINYWGRLKS